MANKAGKGGGAKKYGRNKVKCARYKAENRREKNRKLRAIRNQKREDKLQRLREKRARKAA